VTFSDAFVRLLLFPGLLYAFAAAWLMEWIERKLRARFQHRIGPPFYQPFFDFVKLVSKHPVERPAFQAFAMITLPLAAAAATLGALALLPVADMKGFPGDLVLFVALIEVTPVCAVLAGFVSRSPFGGVGASREALLIIAANVPFLVALFALVTSAGSLTITELISRPLWAVRIPAVLALLMTLPVKLHLNPFSAASAEQEIYTGATTEYDGPRLALWELSRAFEWVTLTGIVAVLAVPGFITPWLVRVPAFFVISLVVVVLLTTLSAATARLRAAQVARLLLVVGSGMSLVALVVALAGW
jgi:NADH-quinone oxidoreductase subunit H